MTENELISKFLERGGRVDKYYIQNPRRGPSLVYLKGWFRGTNLRSAITRAMDGKR